MIGGEAADLPRSGEMGATQRTGGEKQGREITTAQAATGRGMQARATIGGGTAATVPIGAVRPPIATTD
jgi:hypothetical protein